jgi:hypothetical protein
MLRALRILFSNRKTSTHRGKATGRRWPEMLRVFQTGRRRHGPQLLVRCLSLGIIITISPNRVPRFCSGIDRHHPFRFWGPARAPAGASICCRSVTVGVTQPPHVRTINIGEYDTAPRGSARACSSYFAGLVTARLGVPLQQVRIYYSATLPAVLQTPLPSSMVFHRSHIGTVETAAADFIETMCDHVIERGRLALAAIAGVGSGDVGFDQSSGRFFVLDTNWSGILEIAATTLGRSSVSTEFAKKLQRADMYPVSKETQPSAA